MNALHAVCVYVFVCVCVRALNNYVLVSEKRFDSPYLSQPIPLWLIWIYSHYFSVKFILSSSFIAAKRLFLEFTVATTIFL